MNKKNYQEKIETLSFVLNNRLNNKSIILFRNTLRDLEKENKTTLSTFFLKNLIDSNNTRTTANKISKTLKRVEVKSCHLNS